MELATPADRWFEFGPRDVHVWPANLNIEGERLALLTSYLSADERARADRYHFSQDRRRFICARGVLRELLSAYSGTQHPASIRFSYGEYGKPAAIASGAFVPRFNYSRSADTAAFAFTRDRAIGIDIERIEDDEEFLTIAIQHYTHAENVVLASLERAARMTEFFRYWTRREAYLKATGQGLTYLSGDLDVGDAVVHSPGEEGEWILETFDLVDGYASSIAVEGGRPALKLFRDAEFPTRLLDFRTAS